MQHDLFADITPISAPGDLSEFMRRVCPSIDGIVGRLAAKTFALDPIAGKWSRQASIIDSAKKRHGVIIETAFCEALRESNRYSVWAEPLFRVSADADALANGQSYEDCLRTTLPYGTKHRTIQIDCMVFDNVDLRIAAYEVKRGFGQQHDAGKTRSIRRDLRCVQLLLKSYGERRGLNSNTAIARIVFYYGGTSQIKAPLALLGVELDEHFQFPVLARIEAANQYYRDKVINLMRETSL